MKQSTIIGMVVGGLLVIGGSILAYAKKDEIQKFAGDARKDAKKFLERKRKPIIKKAEDTLDEVEDLIDRASKKIQSIRNK